MVNTPVPNKKWAVYSYIQANNNLSSILPGDLAVNYKNINTDDAYAAAMVSYPERREMYNGKIITKLYEVKDGEKLEKADLPYKNMSSPATLKEFLIWAMTNYPADKSMIVLADHGEGWMGTLVDETSGKIIEPEELKNVLDEVYVQTGRRPDIIAFDSCFMANAEMAYELAGRAKIMIGSEEFTSAVMPKEKAFLSISDSSGGVSPEKVAEEWIGQSYGWLYSPMLSAINLDEIKNAGRCASELAEKLIIFIKENPENKTKIKKIIEKSCHFGGVLTKSEPFCHLVDIKDFADNLIEEPCVSKGIKDSAVKLQDEIKRTVLFSTSRCFKRKDFPESMKPVELKQIKDAESFSIYLPTTREAATEPWKTYNEERESPLDENISYKNLQFAKDTQWDEFFELLNA